MTTVAGVSKQGRWLVEIERVVGTTEVLVLNIEGGWGQTELECQLDPNSREDLDNLVKAIQEASKEAFE